jgi:hypothetical protein
MRRRRRYYRDLLIHIRINCCVLNTSCALICILDYDENAKMSAESLMLIRCLSVWYPKPFSSKLPSDCGCFQSIHDVIMMCGFSLPSISPFLYI